MAKTVQIIEKAEIFDDFDGTPLVPDTKPVKYTFGNKTYNLYLSDENHNKVNDFIKNLTDGAEVVGNGTSGSKGVPSASEKERRAQVVKDFNKAHPNANAARYSKTVQAWEASQS